MHLMLNIYVFVFALKIFYTLAIMKNGVIDSTIVTSEEVVKINFKDYKKYLSIKERWIEAISAAKTEVGQDPPTFVQTPVAEPPSDQQAGIGRARPEPQGQPPSKVAHAETQDMEDQMFCSESCPAHAVKERLRQGAGHCTFHHCKCQHNLPL